MAPKKPRNILFSFGYAFRGIYYGMRSQRNMKIHLLAAAIVVIMGLFFSITKEEWMILVFSVFSVMVAELINTAIELNVDMVTKQLRPRAMLAKDVAAGAVLFAAIGSVIVGLFIFGERFFALIHRIFQFMQMGMT